MKDKPIGDSKCKTKDAKEVYIDDTEKNNRYIIIQLMTADEHFIKSKESFELDIKYLASIKAILKTMEENNKGKVNNE